MGREALCRVAAEVAGRGLWVGGGVGGGVGVSRCRLSIAEAEQAKFFPDGGDGEGDEQKRQR